MQLIIYRFCDEDQFQPHLEKVIRTQWSDQAPSVGQMVSMGSDREFEIVEVYTYEATEESRVGAVHMAFIELPGSNLAPAEWDCWRFKRHHPNENFFVQLEDVGFADLGCGFNCLGEPPVIGQRLFGGVSVDQGTALRPVPTPWMIDAFDTFHPIQDSPYPVIYLNWCKAVVDRMGQDALAA